MTLNQALQSILTQPGVDRVTFGLSEKGKPIVLCDQVLQSTNGASKATFQATGDSHEDALENLKQAVSHCGQLQSKILKIKDN